MAAACSGLYYRGVCLWPATAPIRRIRVVRRVCSLRPHAVFLEPFAVAFGILSVALSVRQSVWSWPTAIVNVGLYVLVFFHARLYADMGLQVVYIAISCYGWYQWLYGGERGQGLRVARVPPRQALLLAALGAAGAVSIGAVLARFTHAALPFADATLSAFSLVAQYMMTRKLLENWALWVALDVAYVVMFVAKGLFLTSGLYVVFLVLAVLGHVEWQRSMTRHAAGLRVAAG